MATIPTTATVTMCPSPPVPTISPLLRTTHQCQPSPSSSSSSSIKLSTALVFGETTVDRATESSVMIKPDKWGLQLEKRRKRRRRRLGFERLEPEEDENAGAEAEAEAETETEAIIASVGSTRSGFLSRSEEVQLCLYLKVRVLDYNYLPLLVYSSLVISHYYYTTMSKNCDSPVSFYFFW